MEGKTMSKYKALGVYIFAGGFSVGVKKHFDVDTHFEDGPYGVETSKLNKVIKEAYTVPDEWPVEKFKGKVDFLYANPPCAPWSLCSAGRALHWTEDPRVNAVKRTFALLDAIKPIVWAWESVRPTFVKGRELVDAVAMGAIQRGYSVTVLFVNGMHHGVPQNRARLFVVCHKVEIPWEATGLRKPVTVGDVLGRRKFKTETVSPCEVSQLKLLKKAKEGERLHHTFGRLNPTIVSNRKEGENVKGRPSFQRVRLINDRVSHVLTGGAHLFHPTENRLISVEESAALCGYPPGFTFVGGVARQYAQVAQAVMPPVGEYLARMVKLGLDQNKRIRKLTYQHVEVTNERVTNQQLIAMGGGTMSLEIIAPPPRPAYGGNATTPRTPRARVVGKGSGFRIREMLVKGIPTPKILETIRKEFPGSKAKESDVYWNKRKLDTQGGNP